MTTGLYLFSNEVLPKSILKFGIPFSKSPMILEEKKCKWGPHIKLYDPLHQTVTKQITILN